MADQLTQDDILAAIDRSIPGTYLDPIRDLGEGYELVQGFAKIGERCSLAVARFERDVYILTAQGARFAIVPATFYRQNAGAGAGKVLTGTVLRASKGGQVFKTIADAVFGALDLEITVDAVSVGYGYEWNIAGPFVDPQGNTWPGELDTIDLPLQNPPFWDPSIKVRNDAPADGLGRPDSLSVLGGERNLPRQPNEPDANYQIRIRSLPDTVSPNAILRQLKNFFRPLGLWWRAVETWQHEYQECYDAPDESATPYEPYDANLFCYDDPRDPSPIQNRWLGEQDYLGAFIVEVEQPAAIEDYGFAYDDPAANETDVTTQLGIRAFSAYDVPDSLPPPALAPAYDGVDFGIATVFENLFDLLDEIKGGGIYVVVWIKETA